VHIKQSKSHKLK